MRDLLLASALALALMLAPPLRAEPAATPSECKVVPTTGDQFCKYGNRWHLESPRPAAFAPGDPFPIYEQSMLMDLARYGLPPVDGPWRYYLREGFLYRGSAETGQVIEVLGRAPSR
jgi:hypothetical protein